MKEALIDILKAGGLFCGGFVRDYLIRGEPFNDVDFYFPKVIPEPYASWKFVGGAKTIIIDGNKFHCCDNSYFDISCNIFSFDGQGIVARPTYMEFSYTRSWQMLFNKSFIFNDLRDVRVSEKMKRRGWQMAAIDFRKRAEPFAPSCGVWSDFTLAKERFDALAL
jgi:hypothetical protein